MELEREVEDLRRKIEIATDSLELIKSLTARGDASSAYDEAETCLRRLGGVYDLDMS